MNADPMKGIGGAPTRATTLPTSAAERKKFPVASGCLDYFPDALCAIARLSQVGNDQHNAGKPLHWDRSKSGDEADTMMRHFLQRGTIDSDGVRHSVKMAWRALALLQKELESSEPNQETKYRYFRWGRSIYRYVAGSARGSKGEVWFRSERQWVPEIEPYAEILDAVPVSEDSALAFIKK